MRLVFRTILAALIISIISCSKSDINNTAPIAPPVYLSKVFLVDTTIAAPFDTIGRSIYLYDAQKRPVRMETLHLGGGRPYAGWVHRFQYNGGDTLASISMLEYFDYPGGNPVLLRRDTTHYVFVNGRVSYDSVHGLDASSGHNFFKVNRYTYLPGNMITVASNWKSTVDPVMYMNQQTIRQNFTNGNISYQLDTIISIVPASPLLGSRLENTVVYLNNPNPFARLTDPIRRPYLSTDIGIGATSISPGGHLVSEHSFLSETWNGAGTFNSQSNVKYSYTFRPDGYPSAARETWDGRIRRVIFVYE